MMQRMHTSSERVQRFVARDAASSRHAANAAELNVDATNAFAWNLKPTVHTTAICTVGKYHARRLQEMHT